MATVRRLTSNDAAVYRAIRLEGLERHPEAFGASWETESAEPLSFFAGRLTEHPVFGAFEDDALLGIGGYFAPQQEKTRHRAMLFGMCVRDAARGKGLGRMLVEAVMAHAADHVESLHLTVIATNDTAQRLYERCGFTRYGVEPRSLKVDGRYYDEALMYKRLRS